jgi:hypothetical protein
MKPQNIDLVLVVDASGSMKPCFDKLREHLNDLLNPLQQANFMVRFGLVAYSAALKHENPVYRHTFVGGGGLDMLYNLSSSPSDFFTTDPSVISSALANLEVQGNEDTLLAVDIAVDFPFGPAETTRRVVAVFTDESIENGVLGVTPLAKIPQLIEKLTKRRIQLFVYAPLSPALEEIGSMDRAEIEPVDGGDGLLTVDFKKLLNQMAKSISVSTLQMGSESTWQKAIYGQDKFKDAEWPTIVQSR